MIQIEEGVIRKPIRCVLYGPEGVGKSTFASNAPLPMWSDVEEGSNRLLVKRLKPTPTSYSALIEHVRYVYQNPHICDTYVVDTADAVERLAREHVCTSYNKKGLEDFGYGNGWSYFYEAYAKLLMELDRLRDVGINVIVICHAALRRVDLPNEDGSFDRWELKLQNSQKCNIAAMMKEWADLLLFVNYKTYVVKKDEKDKVGKAKGGQQRVMYTTHHASWDAKNRDGLPEELPLDFGCVAHLFPSKSVADQNYNALCARVEQAQQMPQAVPAVAQPMQAEPVPVQQAPITPATIPSAQGQEMAVEQQQVTMKDMINQVYPFDEQLPDTVVKPLADLMRMNVVSSAEIQNWTVGKGYFPAGMPLGDYPADYQHHIVAQWQFIMAEIKQNRKNQ